MKRNIYRVAFTIRGKKPDVVSHTRPGNRNFTKREGKKLLLKPLVGPQKGGGVLRGE